MSKKRLINPERVLSVVSILFISAAFIVSIILDGDPLSIIPYSQIVIPLVHGLCVLLTLSLLIKTNLYLQVFILLLESGLTILTNYEILGIMFFYSALIVISVNNLFSEKKHKHIIRILFFLHIVEIILTYPHGINITIVAFSASAFFGTFLYWILDNLKAKLSCIIPSKVTENAALGDKKPGSVIYLSEYDLSQRQKNFILDFLHDKLSYKDLSEKYFVSISTVKKEFTEIFKIFEVTKIEELHILLLQYQVKE